MIDKEEFQLHQAIVEWLQSKSISFEESITIVSYAIQMNKSIPESYTETCWKVKANEK